ncbi:hypothetical protein AQUSIP_07170 [Aquicella siphonis]|uniref:Uncharacterized protein n=1 Tax=Aquicella siphonis TaxID=254247 RepID=A0A5E4PG51_9COXI|nr:ADP-ribosylation factor-like protein [Aquicella siphonis]VVC75427.1 hypothetical protein AQUSIP_07170 [Aquicella siphonis]
MEARKDCKVILIGSADSKKAFMDQAEDKDCLPMPRTVGMDFIVVHVNNRRFQLWDMTGQEHFRSITSIYTKNADVYIYIDADPETIKKFESLRDKNTCIAVNFNSFNHSPRDLLGKIDFLFKSEERNEKLNEINIINKSALIMCANLFDDKSLFKLLPPEIASEITKAYYSTKDHYYKQQIFFKCPPQTEQAVESHKKDGRVEISNRRDTEDHSRGPRSGCSIQ